MLKPIPPSRCTDDGTLVLKVSLVDGRAPVMDKLAIESNAGFFFPETKTGSTTIALPEI